MEFDIESQNKDTDSRDEISLWSSQIYTYRLPMQYRHQEKIEEF